MALPITHNEATHHAIVEVCGPPNMLSVPIEAEQEHQLQFWGLPGPENSPNGVGNGPLSVIPKIASVQQIQQPTNQVLQPSSTKSEAIVAIGLPNHCTRPALSNTPSSLNAQNCSKC
jgi:hypothetical protein